MLTALPPVPALVAVTNAAGPSVEFSPPLTLPRWNRRATDGQPTPLSAVVHELRHSLASVVSASEVLADNFRGLDPAQAARMVSTIHHGAVWLQDLVENLLCAETIQSGGFQIDPRPLDLRAVVAEATMVMEPRLARQAMTYRLSTGQSLPLVWGDRRRVGQVALNLIANAIKYGASEQAIDVRLSARDGWVRVTVADRGPGFPKADLDRLFQPFYRGAEARSDQAGVGLGLTIVKAIMDAHDGRVGLSNRRGGGARIWFELPVCAAQS